MDFFKEDRLFYDWLETHPVSAAARQLWHVLMHLCNRTGWQRDFTVANSTLVALCGLSKSRIYEAREELKRNGRVTYYSRAGNLCAVYQITPLSREDWALQAAPFYASEDGENALERDADLGGDAGGKNADLGEGYGCTGEVVSQGICGEKGAVIDGDSVCKTGAVSGRKEDALPDTIPEHYYTETETDTENQTETKTTTQTYTETDTQTGGRDTTSSSGSPLSPQVPEDGSGEPLPLSQAGAGLGGTAEHAPTALGDKEGENVARNALGSAAQGADRSAVGDVVGDVAGYAVGDAAGVAVNAQGILGPLGVKLSTHVARELDVALGAGMQPETLVFAYEQADSGVVDVGKYVGGIVRNWQAAGVYTRQQAVEACAAFRKQRAAPLGTQGQSGATPRPGPIKQLDANNFAQRTYTDGDFDYLLADGDEWAEGALEDTPAGDGYDEGDDGGDDGYGYSD